MFPGLRPSICNCYAYARTFFKLTREPTHTHTHIFIAPKLCKALERTHVPHTNKTNNSSDNSVVVSMISLPLLCQCVVVHKYAHGQIRCRYICTDTYKCHMQMHTHTHHHVQAHVHITCMHMFDHVCVPTCSPHCHIVGPTRHHDIINLQGACWWPR